MGIWVDRWTGGQVGRQLAAGTCHGVRHVVIVPRREPADLPRLHRRHRRRRSLVSWPLRGANQRFNQVSARQHRTEDESRARSRVDPERKNPYQRPEAGPESRPTLLYFALVGARPQPASSPAAAAARAAPRPRPRPPAAATPATGHLPRRRGPPAAARPRGSARPVGSGCVAISEIKAPRFSANLVYTSSG